MRQLWFRKPPVEAIRRFLSEQEPLPFTYRAVGATATTPPAGFVVDHTRVRLGKGARDFEIARAAMKRWAHFQLGWVQSWPSNVPLQPGEVVAVAGRVLGVWWLNVCRIVYIVNESDPVHRFGFAYGTLPGHVECGEERFLIEWDQADDSVWYDIVAFSRPHHVLTRMGYPLVRRQQKKFGRDSAAAMVRAIREAQ